MHDSNMPLFASNGYRKLMHHFNDNLVQKYPNLITNKEKWEFEFDLDEEDEENIKNWKYDQIQFFLDDLKDEYVNEN